MRFCICCRSHTIRSMDFRWRPISLGPVEVCIAERELFRLININGGAYVTALVNHGEPT